MCKAACKRTQQLPTLLRQQCRELLRACWQWCANGCNNSQQCWDLQCTVGRIQPISLCKSCVMSVSGPNHVGRVVQTDPTLLRYASEITEQKKRCELLAEKFDRFQTVRNNTQQHPTTYNRVCKRTQHVTSNDVGIVAPTMLGVVACVLAVVCKRMQQLPTMLRPAVDRGKDKPISLCKTCVMRVRGSNNVGRVVQTHPTLLLYASAITEQKKCWELLAEKFDRFQTVRNNTQQHPTTCNRVCKRTQQITSNNVWSCWPAMLRPFARGFTFKRKIIYVRFRKAN